MDWKFNLKSWFNKLNRTPFDKSTFSGFCAILILDYVWGITYLGAIVVILSLFLSMGLFINTFRTHFESMFRNMDELVGEHRPRDYVIQLKSGLIEAINLHNQAKG